MKRSNEDILHRHLENNGNIISLLQDIQAVFGYIPRESIYYFSEKLNIPSAYIYGVATFYSQFRLNPAGKHKITACCGTACHVKGAEKIIDSLKLELGLDDKEDTTKDGEFTLEKVACLGTCSFAPIVLIDGKVRGKVKHEILVREIKSMKKKK
ncbi:MAG: NAD(P)H-dependent oxidoreductase subunit E [Nitrospiraceae bacterium]|nr:NAD(P)H-dependent oxidoreductase subunit E [Nitrospiraceae bacterium]